MLPQALAAGLNANLSVPIVAGIGILCATAGFYAGRFSMYREATRMVQLALERAARDVRLFRENRVGMMPKHVAYLMLLEAEYICEWRSREENMFAKPTGESRMADPRMPRSRVAQLNERRERQRNQIKAFVNRSRRSGEDEDTRDVSRTMRYNRRYE